VDGVVFTGGDADFFD
jgi:gamma-glutamyl hydrolase